MFGVELSSPVVENAVPVLVSLVVIRIGVKVLQVAYPDAAWVRPIERSISWLAWLGMVLWVTGLLPLVLAMLMNRNRGAQQRGPQAGFNQGGGASGGGGLGDLLGSGGGGLGDLLGSLLGGSGGGGLGDLLSKMQRSGFGEQADSWVGRGQNQPLPPSAMEDVFGRSGLAQLARSAGVGHAENVAALGDFAPALRTAFSSDGPHVFVLPTEPDIAVVRPPIAFDPVLTKHNFMNAIGAPRYVPTLFGGGRLE